MDLVVKFANIHLNERGWIPLTGIQIINRNKNLTSFPSHVDNIQTISNEIRQILIQYVGAILTNSDHIRPKQICTETIDNGNHCGCVWMCWEWGMGGGCVWMCWEWGRGGGCVGGGGGDGRRMRVDVLGMGDENGGWDGGVSTWILSNRICANIYFLILGDFWPNS